MAVLAGCGGSDSATDTNASLNGDYQFIAAEVYDPGTDTFCDQGGTISFNGSGAFTMSGTKRCSDGATVEVSSISDAGGYTVNPDGSFNVTGQDGEVFHGQILLDGNSLLLDSTGRLSAGTLLNHGVAMKR